MAPRARLHPVITLILIASVLGIAACSALRPPLATPTPTQTPTPAYTPTPLLPTATPSPAQILQAAERAFAYGEWQEADALAQTVLAQSPQWAAQSVLLRARSLLAEGNADEAIGILERTEFVGTSLEAQTAYILASAYRDKGDWLKVIEQQTRLLAATEVLTGWMHELNGDAYVQTGDTDAGLESYRLAINASSRTERIRLLEKVADVQVKASLTEDALSTYSELLSLAPGPEFAAKIHYLSGLTLRADGKDEAALDEFREATDASTRAREAYLALVELLNAGEKVDEFRRGLIDYYNGTYQAAVQAFERYLEGAESGDAANARYYSGLAQLALGQHDEAEAALEKALSSATDAEFQAKAVMALARTLEKAQRPSEAREAYRRVQSVCPSCDAAPQAMWRSAELAFSQGDLAAAASDFLWLQRNYPQDSGADDAMLRAALLYYTDSRYAEVAEVCEELLARYPGSSLVAAAHFWSAKAALQSQHQAAAHMHLSAAAGSHVPNYYSLRAAAVLRGDTTILPAPGNVLLEAPGEEERTTCLSWLVSWANKGEPYAFDIMPESLAKDIDFRQGMAYATLGLTDEAAARFSTVRTRWKDAPLGLFQLSEFLRDMGQYRQSIACAERIVALSPETNVFQSPRYLQRLAFPSYYADLVLEEASRNNLDPLLVFALIRQESRFDSLAGSWAGALGLMQVTPPTGEWVALQLGIRGFRREDLFRPALNVRFGAWYLGRQMRDFGGDPLAALAAYNGGPGYARLWLSRWADYDPDLFVESIPVSETQTYVKIILEQYAVYRLLYQPGVSSVP